MSDFALLGFVKTLIKIHKDQIVADYANDERLRQAIKNFKVSMGFGLHVGWAIEGAIGSEYKIDASYLSPNVKISDTLEASTKMYGVPLIISGPLFDIMTVES